jgi:hypothetical protein
VQESGNNEQGRQSRHPGLTIVCVVQGLLQAQVIKAKLETADIPVLLDYESLGPVFGITVDRLGEVRILVPDRHVDEARALIEEE